MKLTIAIPTYKRNLDLLRCLKSIEINSLIKSEIEILISDNDPLNTLNIEDFSFNFPIVYNKNKENLGIMGNMCSLITLAKGEFILFITDDDYFLPGSIEKIINFVATIPRSVNAFKVGLITHLIKSRKAFQNDYGVDQAVNFEEKQLYIFNSSHIFSGSCIRKDSIPSKEFAEHHEKYYYSTSLLFGYNFGNLEYLNDLLIMHTWQNDVYWDFADPGSEELDINWNEMCDYLTGYLKNVNLELARKELISKEIKEELSRAKKVYLFLNGVFEFFGFKVIRVHRQS
jgi:glycosyltransferase involved in cell wall biosynthesis